MAEVEFSKHAQDMMRERNIPEEWVRRTIDDPDRTEMGSEGNTHYIKAISERSGRFLRVVVNPHVQPNRVITVFFDRRLRRKR